MAVKMLTPKAVLLKGQILIPYIYNNKEHCAVIEEKERRKGPSRVMVRDNEEEEWKVCFDKKLLQFIGPAMKFEGGIPKKLFSYKQVKIQEDIYNLY